MSDETLKELVMEIRMLRQSVEAIALALASVDRASGAVGDCAREADDGRVRFQVGGRQG
jgi:prefoldin subunit 5